MFGWNHPTVTKVLPSSTSFSFSIFFFCLSIHWAVCPCQTIKYSSRGSLNIAFSVITSWTLSRHGGRRGNRDGAWLSFLMEAKPSSHRVRSESQLKHWRWRKSPDGPRKRVCVLVRLWVIIVSQKAFILYLHFGSRPPASTLKSGTQIHVVGLMKIYILLTMCWDGFP